MWQKTFEKYKSEGFTVVGLALDAEGIAPAKRYYDRFGVTFPTLVDPNYATGFGAVPKTFFVNEHGVVQSLRGWEAQLVPAPKLAEVTDEIRGQWTEPGSRLDPAEIARLVEANRKGPRDLKTAVDLSSRYLDLNLPGEAKKILAVALAERDFRKAAQSRSVNPGRLLGQACFQMSRASVGNRDQQVRYATLSFYLNPTIGFGKQIARIIAPEKFDGRPEGDFDNAFREGTLRRLRREREEWLEADK
ncbi:MAG: TlpA family protein disulfide reductase [Planctomycetes bacterium]|nr:TlpA family protein disulfide reductase [Planctomycetota bacterium]